MKKTLCLFLTAGLLAGCETLQVQTRADRAARTQDQLIAEENQRRMAGRIETLEMEIGRLGRDMDLLKNQLSSRLAAVEQKSEADKREMIARITSDLEKLFQQSAASVPARSGGYGYEHIVRPGETISTIAKAYNVTARAIIEANRIQNPDVLSVGQKLFIPQ